MLLLAALVIAAADMTDTSGLPEREPAAVGMSSARLSTIDRVVQRGIDAGGYPGAAVVVGRKGYSVLSRGFGALDWSGRVRVSSRESLYDLASLTKVVATTTAIMVLFDAGKVDLDAPVSRYLPDFSGGRRDQVTVRHLLTHRAGLPAGRELWRIAKTPAAARAAVLASPIQCTPGSCYEYSDLGADLLGFVAEAASGQSLDAFLERSVFTKLGMTDTHFRPDAMSSVRTAPTEIAPPRGYPLRGEVHDENAYALGGVAGAVLPHVAAHFGDQYNLVALARPRFKPAANDTFAFPALMARHPSRIDIGRVDGVQAGIGGGIQNGERGRFIRRPAKDICPQNDGRDRQARLAEGAVLHRVSYQERV